MKVIVNAEDLGINLKINDAVFQVEASAALVRHPNGAPDA
jgi:hypothetical protein